MGNLTKSLQSYVRQSGFTPEALYNYPARHLIPEQYLEEVGIRRIAEMICYGVSTLSVAKYLKVSAIILRRWIKEDPERHSIYQTALEVAGEEFAFQAINELDEADIHSKADVARVTAIADHFRFMAKSFNKDMFSERKEIKGGNTAPFVLNVSFDRKKQAVIELDSDSYGEA